MSLAMELKATMRQYIGKAASRRLRHAEQVPAIVYGGGKKPQIIRIEARIIKKALEEESFYSQIITLTIDNNKSEQVILKDLQRHPVKDYALHMDFLRISSSQELTTSIPLHFINEEQCIGVKLGGKIFHNINEIEIRCLPKNLPEYIEVDVSKLDIGSTIHLTDIKIPKGVQLTRLLQDGSHNLSIVTVSTPKQEIEEESTEDKSEKTENSDINKASKDDV